MKNNENFIYNVDVEQIMQEIKYDIEILKRFKDYLRDHYIGEIYQNKPVWHFITYVSLFGDMFYQQYHVIRDQSGRRVLLLGGAQFHGDLTVIEALDKVTKILDEQK